MGFVTECFSNGEDPRFIDPTTGEITSPVTYELQTSLMTPLDLMDNPNVELRGFKIRETRDDQLKLQKLSHVVIV